MIRVIRSAARTMTRAYSTDSSCVVSPLPIIAARASITLSGVPSSCAIPDASFPTVIRRSAWRSCSSISTRAFISFAARSFAATRRSHIAFISVASLAISSRLLQLQGAAEVPAAYAARLSLQGRHRAAHDPRAEDIARAAQTPPSVRVVSACRGSCDGCRRARPRAAPRPRARRAGVRRPGRSVASLPAGLAPRRATARPAGMRERGRAGGRGRAVPRRARPIGRGLAPPGRRRP